MNTLLLRARGFLVSLKLTVVLLALSIILIFWATLDQVNLGVWAVQHKFFHAFFVVERFGSLRIPVFPGGYAIGGLLLLNLVAGHIYRFKMGWNKAGIWIAHAGLILLLLGELISGLVQKDYQMRIEEGQTVNFAESSRLNELAVIDTSDPASDEVVAIPESLLARGTVVQSPKLAFRVVPKAYYENATIQMRAQAPNAPPSLATVGMGTMVAVTQLDATYKEDERNVPAAFVELIGPDGTLGTWLVSPGLGNPQKFDFAGKTWKIVMRPKRVYQPYSLTLEKFSHDVYPGTDIPKNFSSRVRINPADGGPGRDVLIYMNNPLRYAGLTYYQQGYDGEHTTILEVVRNPSWLAPYIACTAITLGLVVQFLIHLARFAKRRGA